MPRTHLPHPYAIDESMFRLVRQLGPDKTICPSEVARDVAGPEPNKWRPLMEPIKERAIQAARAGRVDIKKAGRVVDPDGLSGIYRITIRKT